MTIGIASLTSIGLEGLRATAGFLRRLAAESPRRRARIAGEVLVGVATFFAASFGLLVAIAAIVLALPLGARQGALGGLALASLVAGAALGAWLVERRDAPWSRNEPTTERPGDTRDRRTPNQLQLPGNLADQGA